MRSALRKQPDAFVVVTGCYAQLKPEEIANIPGVDLVLGAGEKFRILDYVDDLSKAQGKGMVPPCARPESQPPTVAPPRAV